MELINFYLTLIFTFEVLAKMAAEQEMFTSDPFNLFDTFIVVTGLIELTANSNSMSSFRILRMARLLRILRFIEFLTPLRAIFRVIVVTTSGIVYIAILVALFMFIFAVCGMQLFGGKFDFEHQEQSLLRRIHTSKNHMFAVVLCPFCNMVFTGVGILDGTLIPSRLHS